MKRGVLEPEPGVVIRILELPNICFGAYRILPNSTRFDLQVSGTTKRGISHPLVQFHRSVSATWHNFAQLHLSVCPGHEAREGPAQATGHLRA